jgi:MFS family permease
MAEVALPASGERAYGLRRVVAIVSATALFEGMFYSALAPQLATIGREVHASSGKLGLLTASSPILLTLGAIPTAWVVTRIGVRLGTVAGLLLLSAGSLAFALAHDYTGLLAARSLQGLAAGTCWTAALIWLVQAAPTHRRGELLGIVFSALAGGTMLGPLLGALAVSNGRHAAFGGAAAVGVVLAVMALGARAPRDRGSGFRVGAALRHREMRTGAIFSALTAVPVGALVVLAPLRLDLVHVGATGVAVTFLVAAGLTMLAQPLVGRWSDRRGRLGPLLASVVLASGLLLVLGSVSSRPLALAVVVLALLSCEIALGPVTALLADTADRLRLDAITAVVALLVVSPIGLAVGAGAAGVLKGSVGAFWAGALVAGPYCALGLAYVVRLRTELSRHEVAGG